MPDAVQSEPVTSRRATWLVGGIVVAAVVIPVVLVIGVLGTVLARMSTSEPCKLAIAAAEADERVQARLGSPVRPGMFVIGSLNDFGDSGKADITVPISGPKGEGTVYVIASKVAGNWKLERLVVEFEADSSKLELVRPVR